MLNKVAKDTSVSRDHREEASLPAKTAMHLAHREVSSLTVCLHGNEPHTLLLVSTSKTYIFFSFTMSMSHREATSDAECLKTV